MIRMIQWHERGAAENAFFNWGINRGGLVMPDVCEEYWSPQQQWRRK